MKYNNVCPKCGSKNIEILPSYQMCYLYYLKCKDCGYSNESEHINRIMHPESIEPVKMAKSECLDLSYNNHYL